MVASIKPHRDELGLGDGRMLIDGDWVASADEASWSHRHPATGEQVASFPVAGPGDVTSLPSGHDAWVVGDEPAVVVDWYGASNYAKSG